MFLPILIALTTSKGAVVPYITYEAEDGEIGGGAQVIKGGDRQPGTLQGEASGRAAVRLSGGGSYVEITATAAANSIVARIAITTLGLDESKTLTASVNGKDVGKLKIVTRYTHLCGSNSDPNKCGAGTEPGENAFHFYDDSKLLLDSAINSGDKVRLYIGDGDSAPWYGVDLIDLEQVAGPIGKPDGLLSIADFGAQEGADSADAFEKAINEAVSTKAKGIYIPKGNWGMGHKVPLPGAINSLGYAFEFAGAGLWHSRIFETTPGSDDWGNWGFNCNGQTAHYHDFMFDGENRIRTEGGKPLVNGYGENTVIENLWVEHSTIGFWVGGASSDFPDGTSQTQKQSKGLIIRNCRIRNTGADGINLCAGTTGALVENVHVRASGDDSFATWSQKDGWVDSDSINPGGCQDNTFKQVTAELAWRANAFGVYGGKNNQIVDSIAKDTLTYHGLMIDGQTFQCSPPTGTFKCTGSSFIATGGSFWGQTWPAIGLYSNPGQEVTISGCEILDSLYGVFRFEGEGHGLYENIKVDSFCKWEGADPPSVWGVGFIFTLGSGSVTFKDVVQTNWGKKGISFYANPAKLPADTYKIDTGCNFDYDGPL